MAIRPHRSLSGQFRDRLVIPVDASRRKFLVAFGVAYLAIGFSYASAGPDTPARHALQWTHVPFWLLGLLWVACGAVATAASFVPTTRDKPGFLCLSIPPTLWALSYAVAQVLVWLTEYDAPRAWVSVIVFAVIAFAVDVVSGMIDAELAGRATA